MVSGFVCGTSSLPRDEDDIYERHTRSADSSPRKSRSKSSNNDKNPYSKRGLDKFSALLEEIEEKRQQIYSKVVDPNEISLVRFAYAGDHQFKPIVIKAKPKGNVGVGKDDHRLDKPATTMNHITEKSRRRLGKLASSSAIIVKDKNMAEDNDTKKALPKTAKRLSLYGKLRVEPRFYLLIICIFILGFLVVFGRSFAILCTSIGWYIIPTIANNANSCSNSRASFKRKDYAMRRLSEKKLSSREGAKSFKTSDAQSKHHRKNV